MGNLNCCCKSCCCCREESPPVRSRSSSSNPDYYGRRIRLWPPNSGDPELEPNEDSTKVIMKVVPCDYSDEEDEVDSTAHENFASGTSLNSLPHHGINEEDQSKAEGDAGRCGNVYDNEPSRMHVIDLDAWNTKRYDSSSEEEDTADHTIIVIAQVHAEFSSQDTEDEEIETANENVDDIVLENPASETTQDSVPQARTSEEDQLKAEVDEEGSANDNENGPSHMQVTDLHGEKDDTIAVFPEEPCSNDADDVERETTNENVDSTASGNSSETIENSLPQLGTNEDEQTKSADDAGVSGSDSEDGLSHVQEEDMDAWDMQEYDWTSDEEDYSDDSIYLSALDSDDTSSSESSSVDMERDH